MSTIESASMMNNIGINISSLSILLRILQHKIGAKLFVSESKMTNLCDVMNVPQFGEYKYTHELGSKPELIVYWVRDSSVMFNKEINLFINSNQLKFNEISRIDMIVGGDHGQGAFRFPVKLLFVMKSTLSIERTSSVAYILCKHKMVIYSRVQ